jgi:cytochrome c oxidase subunit 2
MQALAETTPFENTGYSPNIGFNTPMSTIAGLTDWAQDINHVYAITTWICTFIFFAVAIPVIVAIKKFRRKPGETDDVPPAQLHGNAMLEFTWTLVPCILLLFIAVPTWKAIFKEHEAPRADALKIEVIGHQWWWEFRYTDLGVTTGGELSLPENTQIAFTLRSADVVHSFWIPQFGGKVDAMPGDHINRMVFTTPSLDDADKASGKYYQGQCAELCGLSHALMRFNVILRTKDQFAKWVKTYNEPPVVETAQQRHGEQLFNQCIACHTISGTPSANIPGDKTGPDLSNFGNRGFLAGGSRRNTEKNLYDWLKDPPGLKPGALMPNLGLSDDDIAALTTYLRQSTAKKF